MPIWKGVVRSAAETDAAAVLAFYEKDPNKHVLGRADSVRKACEEGRQFLVEVDTAIVATSGFFLYGDTKLIEVGGTRVADSWQGFKLQRVLFWARFAAIALTEPDAKITTGVDSSNGPSKEGILRMSFEAWPNPDATLLVECDPGEGRAGCEKKRTGLAPGAACCSDFFLLPHGAWKSAIGEFLAATGSQPTILLSRKNGDALELEGEVQIGA